MPVTIDRAIDRVSESIKPPLSDDKLSSKIKRAADQFKFTITHAVQQHITDKYTGVCRHLASVDDNDFDQARSIAKKQIIRGSGRITENRADNLISVVRSDYQQRKRDNYDWNVARRKKRDDKPGTSSVPADPAPPAVSPIPTSNRFAPLGDMATQEVANAMDLSFSEEMEDLPQPMPLPPRNTRRRELSSSPELSTGKTPVKKSKSDDKHPPKNKPLASTATSGTPPTSRPPNPVGQMAPPGGAASSVEPVTDDEITAEEAAEIDTPAAAIPAGPIGAELFIDLSCDRRGRSMTPASTQTHFVPRLASFAPNQRSSWTLPEVAKDENVLVLADSNGKVLAQRTPPNWRVASYRGGKLRDVIDLLQHKTVPGTIKSLIVHMGINDRIDASPPMVNQLTKLREVLSLQRRQVLLLSIPYFEEQPRFGAEETHSLNTLMAEVFDGSDILRPLPDDMEFRPYRQDDYAHYAYDSAEKLVRFLRPLLALN